MDYSSPIDFIKVPAEIEAKFLNEDGDKFKYYRGTITNIHNYEYDAKGKFVECTVIYDDGDEVSHTILHENDFESEDDDSWRFVDSSSKIIKTLATTCKDIKAIKEQMCLMYETRKLEEEEDDDYDEDFEEDDDDDEDFDEDEEDEDEDEDEDEEDDQEDEEDEGEDEEDEDEEDEGDDANFDDDSGFEYSRRLRRSPTSCCMVKASHFWLVLLDGMVLGAALCLFVVTVVKKNV